MEELFEKFKGPYKVYPFVAYLTKKEITCLNSKYFYKAFPSTTRLPNLCAFAGIWNIEDAFSESLRKGELETDNMRRS